MPKLGIIFLYLLSQFIKFKSNKDLLNITSLNILHSKILYHQYCLYKHQQYFIMNQNQSDLRNSFNPDGIHIQYDDENHHQDFSSVENLISLPPLRKVKPYQNLFPPVEKELQQSDIVSAQLKQTMIDLREKLRDQFCTFDNPNGFTFSFPQSKFPSVQPGTRNIITYEQKNIVEEEDTFRDRLSPEQIQQISQDAQFKVRSNQEYITLPYVWKINDTLFRGRKNIQLAWFKTLAKAHSIYFYALNLVKQEIPKQVTKMKQIPSRLFSLFLGKRSMRTTYDIYYHGQVAKDFWDQVMEKHYVKSKQWGSQLWQYFDAGYKAQYFMSIVQDQQDAASQNYKQLQRQYNKKIQQRQQLKKKYNQKVAQRNTKKQKILAISAQFQRNWAKNKKKVLADISSNNPTNKQGGLQDSLSNKYESQQLIKKKKQQQNEQQLLQKLNDRKFQHYTAFLEKKLPKAEVPYNVIEAIITILTLMQIVSKKQRKFNAKKAEQKGKIQQQIKQKHKIKQYDTKWYNQQVQKLYQPILKKLNQEYYNKFIDYQLIKRMSIKQRQVYNLWLEYRVTYDARIQAKKRQIQPILEPKRIFYSTYQLLPPYKVLKKRNGDYVWYQMVREAKIQITTETNFWKVKLYIMRVKSWTINCVIFLLYSCWSGPFGLRCLWGIAEFKHNQSINIHSGQIYNQTRKPVLGVFNTVLQGIRKSREHFQALPDRGLFGKNFSRLFNYIECYLFRLLFVGIFLTLILYPISIVVLSILTAVLIITVWAWMPVVLLITYLFNTILFQFQSSWIPYGFWVRAAPLPSLIISLLGNLLRIVLYVLCLTIYAPIAAFLIIFFAGLSRGFRTATDAIMLFLISKLGRTPSRNTAIAKKISGPGMSKQYYMSIQQQDVYILVQSSLQQIFMSHFNRIFSQKLNSPIQKLNKVMSLLINPLQLNNYTRWSPNSNNPIYESVNIIRNRFSIQYQNYMNRYPSRPYNIRFTQEEIDSYFENTVSIVKNFVQKKEIKSWIFQQYHILEDYDELTRKIWMDVFSCGQEIFQPLQKIDQRFKLEDMYKNDYDYQNSSSYGSMKMKKNVHKVMQALQGQIDLKPRKANLGHFNHALLSRQFTDYGDIVTLYRYMDDNSEGRVQFDTNNPKFLFYPNQSIKQIIKKDNYEYRWRKQLNQKNKNKQ